MRRRGPVPGQYGRLPAAVAAVIGAMNAGKLTPSEAARSAVLAFGRTSAPAGYAQWIAALEQRIGSEAHDAA